MGTTGDEIRHFLAKRRPPRMRSMRSMRLMEIDEIGVYCRVSASAPMRE